ncbi:hypothetical protein [Streptomyces sp. NPDC088915]|uniref:hypothetical protein n=1 Tax=Streptomyces sp. NPDC088915 TaxID=3365912 RepID=UPI0037F12BC2
MPSGDTRSTPHSYSQAADEFRFPGSWMPGGRGRQTVVLLTHLLTTPRTNRQIARASTTKTPHGRR